MYLVLSPLSFLLRFIVCIYRTLSIFLLCLSLAEAHMALLLSYRAYKMLLATKFLAPALQVVYRRQNRRAS
jgi:hypothetical protein